MHGRVWHDVNKTRPKLLELVKKNTINDSYKEVLAKENGYRHLIFWDDEQETWLETVRKLYEST